MRRSRKSDEFEVRGVADRLLAYEIVESPPLEHATGSRPNFWRERSPS